MKIKRNEEFVEGAEVYARVAFRNLPKLVILGKKAPSFSIAWDDNFYEFWDCTMLTDLGEAIQRNTIAIQPEDFEEDYKEINNIT